MAGAEITLTDAAGRTATTTAATDGSYRFEDLSGYTTPFQIQASASMGEAIVTHHALVGSAPGPDSVANITPLTTAVTALAGPSAVPKNLSASELAALTPTALQDAQQRLGTVIGPLADKLGLPTNFDLLQTRFTANGRGADLLLDHLDINIAPSGITIANKMAVATDGQSTAATGSRLVPGSTDAPTPLADTSTTSTDGFDELASRFTQCFSVPSTQRLTVSGGSGTLDAACQGLASGTYLHNGTPFMERWAATLNATTFDGTTFARPVVRLRLSASPERIAVNLNFKDSQGNGYTRPEIIERGSDGTWTLIGNQRAFNAYAEAQANYVNELTPNTTYNNLNNSRVDTGFRLAFDPRASIDAAGQVTYHGLDLANTTGYSPSSWTSIQSALPAGSRMIGCVIVRGPGETSGAKWAGFHPNGLLLKRPTGSSAQDYLAIDSVVSTSWRTVLDATPPSATGAVAAPSVGALTNLCGAGSTTSSSSSYVIDARALGPRTNILTGTLDSTIAGRDQAWNTGARFARQAPSDALARQLASNPPLTFEVFDTDGKLRFVFSSRYLGSLPEVDLAQAYVDNGKVPTFSEASVRRYLDFSSASATVTQTVTGSVTLDWSAPVGAFGADRIGLYAEVYRATPGEGIRGPLSRAYDGTANTNSLWSSDADLAAYLDALTGTNFYWWNGAYATSSGTSLVSTNGVNVARSDRSIGSTQAYGGSLFGLSALNSASLGTASHAALYRELFFRTYTDTNVRLYVTTSNRAVRTP